MFALRPGSFCVGFAIWLCSRRLELWLGTLLCHPGPVHVPFVTWDHVLVRDDYDGDVQIRRHSLHHADEIPLAPTARTARGPFHFNCNRIEIYAGMFNPRPADKRLLALHGPFCFDRIVVGQNRSADVRSRRSFNGDVKVTLQMTRTVLPKQYFSRWQHANSAPPEPIGRRAEPKKVSTVI